MNMGDSDDWKRELRIRLEETNRRHRVVSDELLSCRLKLAHIIDALSDRFREEAKLCYLEGLSWGQIAIKCRTTETVVKNKFKVIIECVRTGLRLQYNKTPDELVTRIRALRAEERDFATEVRELMWAVNSDKRPWRYGDGSDEPNESSAGAGVPAPPASPSPTHRSGSASTAETV
jgi:hypothetical protein